MTAQNPIGIISDEVSQNYDHVVRFAQEFSLDGVELRSSNGKAFKDLTKNDIAAIAQKNRDAGLAMPCLATPIFKCELDDHTQIQKDLDLLKRSIAHASVLGADIIRVFSFLRRHTPTTTHDLKQAAEIFSLLVEAARGTNVRIGLENESSTLVCTGAEAASFLQLVPDKQVGLVWDPCNILFLPGENELAKKDFPLISNRIIHVHVKNAKRNEGKAASHCVDLKSGDIDYELHLRLLRETSYQGWINLETHWRITALSAAQAHLPAGEIFSANAEEPSRICMSQLISLVRGNP